MLDVEHTANEHNGQVILYHFLEDYFEYECFVTLLLYIFRYTVALATMVFISCCSIESLKFIVDFFLHLCYLLLRVLTEQNHVS